jgi:hypothetical protein
VIGAQQTLGVVSCSSLASFRTFFVHTGAALFGVTAGHVLEEAIKAVDDPAVECILGTTCGRRPKYCRAACRAAAHRRQRDGSPAFRAFTDRMRDRLALGEARYGNTTFAKSPGGRSYALALTVPPAVRRVEERLQLNDSLFLQSRKVLIGQSCQFLVNSIIVVADGD